MPENPVLKRLRNGVSSMIHTRLLQLQQSPDLQESNQSDPSASSGTIQRKSHRYRNPTATALRHNLSVAVLFLSGCSSLVAHLNGLRGRRFESSHPDFREPFSAMKMAFLRGLGPSTAQEHKTFTQHQSTLWCSRTHPIQLFELGPNTEAASMLDALYSFPLSCRTSFSHEPWCSSNHVKAQPLVC